jgi:hypothetical protein
MKRPTHEITVSTDGAKKCPECDDLGFGFGKACTSCGRICKGAAPDGATEQPPVLPGRFGTHVCDFLAQLSIGLQEVTHPEGQVGVWVLYLKRATNLGMVNYR